VSSSLLGATAAWPTAARTQPSGKTYRIGFLGATSLAESKRRVDGFRTGLRRFGYEEGKNIVILYRWAEGRYERLRELAAELAEVNVDVLVTHGTPGSLAAKEATSNIPIVMAAVGDPVEAGLVASLARPGGNLTGLTFFFTEICAKRAELIKEAIPRLTRLGVLVNPGNPAHPIALAAMRPTASALGVELVPAEVKAREDISTAIASVVRRQLPALVVIDDGLLISNATYIAGPGVAEPTTNDWVQASGGSRRAAGIWRRSCGPFLSLGGIGGQDSEGQPAGRLTDRASGQI
jgi:ABC-type uncharacterized transport system substrate-binding protein